MPEAGGLVDYYIANFAQNVNRHKKTIKNFLSPLFHYGHLIYYRHPLIKPGAIPSRKKENKAVFFAPAARFFFLPFPFPESKISAPAERKNRFFFKASPASGAAQKDKGLKLKSEHRHNVTVIVVLIVGVQTAASKVRTPRAVV